MLQIFYGDDRLAAEKEIIAVLGTDRETIEGENLTTSDLPTILQGASLFADERKILLKDISGSAAWEEFPKYLDTDHQVIVWESKLDKRTVTYKALQKSGVTIREFATPEPPEAKQVFQIFDLAVAGNYTQAIAILDKLQPNQDPYMFFGLMISQALRGFERDQRKFKPILKNLARTDISLKTTGLDPWLLIRSCLLKLSS